MNLLRLGRTSIIVVILCLLLAASAAPLLPQQAEGLSPTLPPTVSLQDSPNAVAPAYAPNRVIVKFSPDAAMGVMGRGGKQAPGRLAQAMQQLGVRRVEPLLPHMWQTGSAGPELAVDRAERIMARRPVRSLRAGRRQHDIPDIENTLVLQLSPAHDALEVAERLGRLPWVVYAEPDYYAELASVPTNDPYFSSSGSWGQPYADQWALHIIGAEVAWDVSNGSGVVVAVIDTGVDYLHEDLAGQMWTNPDEIPGNGVDDDHNGYVDDVMGWDFAGASTSAPTQDNDPMDGYGHGTVVAGTIAAATDNGVGVASLAYGARIMALKCSGDAEEQGYLNGSSIDSAVVYAAENGADVVNCSFGGGVGNTTRWLYQYAESLGCVVVAAAGNENTNQHVAFPGGRTQTITVGASNPYDAMASFSNWGTWIDLLAPGVDVLVPSYWANHLGYPWVGSGYQALSGTSLSAPLVSGTVALILARHPEFNLEEIRGILRASADDVGAPLYDRWTGYGRLNAASAVQIDAPCRAIITSPAEAFRNEGGSFDRALPGRDEVEICGTADGIGFASYDLAYGRSYDPTSWTVFAASSTPVPDGALGVWDASILPQGSYQVRLTVYDATGRHYEDHVLLLNCSDEEPGYPRREVFSTIGPIMAGDFDGDGKQEITGRSNWSFGRLTSGFLSGASEPVWADTLESLSLQGQPWGDISGDGIPEVVGPGPDDYLYLYARRLDGTVLPGWPLPITTDGTSRVFLTLADVNDDAILEVVFPHRDGSSWQIHLCRGDSTELPGWPLTLPSIPLAQATVADITGDGVPEVVVPVVGAVYAWHLNGTAVAGWPVSYGGEFGMPIAAADLNADGASELIVTNFGGINCLQGAGTPLPGWPKVVRSSQPASTPGIGDVNGDGRLEIVSGECVSGTNQNKVHVWRADGTELVGWPQVVAPIPCGFGIADLDGDGAMDILCGSWRNGFVGDSADDNFVFAWHADGTLLGGFPKELVVEACHIGIANLTASNTLSVVCSDNQGGMHAWDTGAPYRTDRIEWAPGGYDTTANFVYHPQVERAHATRITYAALAPGTGLPGDLISCQAYATDPWGHRLTYSWSNGGVGGTFPSGATGKDVEYLAPQGEWTEVQLHLVVTCDGPDPLQDDRTLVLTRPAGHTLALSVNAGTTDLLFGQSTPLFASYADSEGHEVATWSWSDGKTGGIFLPSSTVQNPTYVAPALIFPFGELQLAVTAICSGTSSATGTATLPIFVRNQVHTIALAMGVSPQTNGPGEPVHLDAIVSDSQGHPWGGWQWYDGGAHGTFSPNPNVKSPTYTPPVATADGPITLMVTGKCSYLSEYAMATGVLHVGAHTLCVTVGATPSTVPSHGATALSASATDSLEHAVASWLWSDGGAGGSFSSTTVASPTYTAPANLTDSNLTITFTVTGTCSGTRSDTKTTTLTVQPVAHTLTVTANAPSPSTVASGGTTNLSATATDSRTGHTFTWSWSDGGAGGSFSSSTSRTPTYTAAANTTDSNRTVTLSVTGTCSGGMSDSDSTTLIVRALPAAPSSLSATAVSTSQINLAWTDSSDNETGFNIERKIGASGSWSEIGTVGANVVAYPNTGLTAGGLYYYRVRAYNAAGDSSYSNETSARPFLVVPPTNLVATVSVAGPITLTWSDNATTEKGYRIERKMGAGGTWAQIAATGINVVLYRDRALEVNTLYYYRVCAYITGGNSPYSNEASGTSPALNAPDGLVATAVSTTQINLVWRDNSGNETGFKVERKIGAATTWSTIATLGVNAISYQNTGLTAGLVHYYRVRAFNATVSSPCSNGANAIPMAIAIAPPSALLATVLGAGPITLAWTDNSNNETGFKIERKTGSGGSWAQIATVGAGVVTYRNSGLALNTPYYYRVRAYYAGGDSTYSAEASGTTSAINAPDGLTATAASSSQINLAWRDNSANETGFKIERRIGASTTWTQIATVGVNVKVYQNTGLTTGTLYTYRVRSYNATYTSVCSNGAGATTP